MKKRRAPKVKLEDPSEIPLAEGADGAGFLIETDESAGIHVLGKQDLERHFPDSESASDEDRIKK